jgi:hypothetical protein
MSEENKVNEDLITDFEVLAHSIVINTFLIAKLPSDGSDLIKRKAFKTLETVFKDTYEDKMKLALFAHDGYELAQSCLTTAIETFKSSGETLQ